MGYEKYNFYSNEHFEGIYFVAINILEMKQNSEKVGVKTRHLGMSLSRLSSGVNAGRALATRRV